MTTLYTIGHGRHSFDDFPRYLISTASSLYATFGPLREAAGRSSMEWFF
jgi:hypothetical protein